MDWENADQNQKNCGFVFLFQLLELDQVRVLIQHILRKYKHVLIDDVVQLVHWRKASKCEARACLAT